MKIFDKKYRVALFQLVGWSVVLITTMFWSVNPGFESFDMIMFMIHILPLVFLYVINYTFVIPKFLYRNNYAGYITFNIVLLLVMLFISYAINTGLIFEDIFPEGAKRRRANNLVFLARDMINYVTMVGLVTAVRLIGRLRVNEEALKVAESARVKSELANLRSQINPHFLLNTLNNIYSLTVIDVEKAQKAIQELSRLLQYILYDNASDMVPLNKEIAFIKNYIELMRIRLNSRVKLTVEFNVKPNSQTQIAPLVFISLIENAFKHGVGVGCDSFISIRFDDMEDKGEVELVIANSNNAKSDRDKSGSGIGLEQVRKRLELQYHDAYVWNIEDDKEVYSSKLILKTR